MSCDICQPLSEEVRRLVVDFVFKVESFVHCLDDVFADPIEEPSENLFRLPCVPLARRVVWPAHPTLLHRCEIVDAHWLVTTLEDVDDRCGTELDCFVTQLRFFKAIESLTDGNTNTTMGYVIVSLVYAKG